MRALTVFVFFTVAFLPTASLAAPAKVVKSAPDRTCIESEGKLNCTLKSSKNRAQNLAIQRVPKTDGANFEKNKDEVKPAKESATQGN